MKQKNETKKVYHNRNVAVHFFGASDYEMIKYSSYSTIWLQLTTILVFNHIISPLTLF